MSITEAIEVFNKLLKTTDNKGEIKIYKGFIQILNSLKSKGLTESQSPIIQKELDSLQLDASTDNLKKYYKQKLSEFKVFLKEEFYFTTEKHYTEIGMVYGMIFGTALGMFYGTSIESLLGSSMSLSMGTTLGMLLGILYGARKDAEAKKLGRVV
ncbi:hypothetical protein [Cyclobacterium amurskyense]|uniref:Uncharacterized protein n=1 Tax=Cyclobacterium amurskyense TaxID=320787 RepID=A0A0H4PAN2_9BACT|nr:hypothetical protein [Cyclobacterium amurskyense]AKP50195.1 hypothetical protein CA2015_0732 [Cyclobacterium amurskyense]|tara:strand:- start:90 stop:554 length:465 start_codon:yes stop_codon:yes gene_type:complete